MDWEKIRKNLRDGAALSIDKIEEYTKIGKLKIDQMGAKRKIERNFADIGERTYDLVCEGKGNSIDSDIAVKKGMENVGVLKQELVVIAAKIKEIQDEAGKGKTSRPVSSEDDVTGI